MSQPTLLCNTINFRARQRGDGKALLLWTSKSVKAARARFSRCLRDPTMSVGLNFGFNIQETTLTAAVGLERWKSLQDERRIG